MKGKYSALIVLLLPVLAISNQGLAQITLTGNDYLSTPSVVISDIIKVEGVTIPSQLSSVGSNDKIRTYKFVDGFGRPLQEIGEGVTPNGKDLIQLYKYDEFGRSTKQYLPFEYTSVSSGTPYQDRATAITNQASFYSTNTLANKIAADSKPYIQADVEQSPMQRLLKQGNAGDGFQTDQHYKTMTYRVNDASDNIRKWEPDGTSAGTYAANDLSVTEGTDENGVKGLVFTDKLGRVVLKRQQADETIGGTTYPFFDTYYVYDLLGNISYVVPPKAVVKLTAAGWNVSNAPELIFSYKYDIKNRVTEKKTPGAAVVYIVYDPLDRVVLVQSGTMRANNKWFYSKYDASGRVIIEGVYTDNTNTTLAGMQSYINGLSCYESSSTAYYEQRIAMPSLDDVSFYTDYCFPKVTDGNGVEERIYNHYDDYDYGNTGTVFVPPYSNEGLPGEGSATNKVLGLTTVVCKRKLGTSEWIKNTTCYDSRYNVIQTYLQDPLANSLHTSVIDFGGRLNESKSKYILSRTYTFSIRNSYTYDKMNRLKEVKQGHDGGTMIIVARYEYNPLGQLVDKKLHSTNSGSSFLQSVDFRYNTRGQLTSINNSTLGNDAGVTNDETNDVWGMNLLYEQADAGIGNTANWTGMLSAVKWKASVSGGNSDQRAYLFSYDKLYRLTAASYKAYNTGTGTWTKDENGFNETITYDWNGNITTMKRNAVISGSVMAIDDMVYDYGTSNDNNKLLNMAESSSNSYGYRNFTSSGSGYTYDVNGNLTADAKKGTTITYNELNKPVTITQTSTGKYVQFSYDAAGSRTSKVIYDGSTTVTEYFVGALVLDQNKVVKHFAMAEGRVRKNSTVFTYEYFITDHQGNVRVSFEDNGSGTAVVRQENSYYPYGMLMPGNYMPTDPNKRLYNAGSEWQDDFGGIIDYFSTFFREYDPVIGRFNGVDPKAEVTVELSVYHYAGNNPVTFNDPMGDAFGTYYMDGNGNKWHSQSPLQGTGFGYTEINWIAGRVTFDNWQNDGSTYYFGGGFDLLTKVREAVSKLTTSGMIVYGSQVKFISRYGSNAFVINYRNPNGEPDLGVYLIKFPAASLREAYRLSDTFWANIGFDVAEFISYNPKNNFWFSWKIGKFYDFKFPGNGNTGGRVKMAKTFSKVWNGMSKGLGAFDAYQNWQDLKDGKIGQGRYYTEQSVNVITTLAPPAYSIPITIGWEGGKWLTSFPWYRKGRAHVQDFFGHPDAESKQILFEERILSLEVPKQ